MSTEPTTPVSDPLDLERLIDRAEFQRLLAISKATFERWVASKKVLPPVRLSRTCHRWRLGTVLAWLRDGCPCPEQWLAARRKR